MNIYDFVVKDDKLEDVALSKYKGKVLLIINTATHCGKTPQYTKIEELYAKYKEDGLVVLDFPCNQFLGQAPGTNEEIVSFCQLNYGTTFPIFSKINVNGRHADPLFVFLKNSFKKDITSPIDDIEKLKKGRGSGGITWNFTKFLIGRDGEVVGRFAPSFLPEDLEPYIIEQLKK